MRLMCAGHAENIEAKQHYGSMRSMCRCVYEVACNVFSSTVSVSQSRLVMPGPCQTRYTCSHSINPANTHVSTHTTAHTDRIGYM